MFGNIFGTILKITALLSFFDKQEMAETITLLTNYAKDTIGINFSVISTNKELKDSLEQAKQRMSQLDILDLNIKDTDFEAKLLWKNLVHYYKIRGQNSNSLAKIQMIKWMKNNYSPCANCSMIQIKNMIESW